MLGFVSGLAVAAIVIPADKAKLGTIVRKDFWIAAAANGINFVIGINK